MKGYLLLEQPFVIGEGVFAPSDASENNYSGVFEDDGDTGYFYAAERIDGPDGLRILDALHIYNVDEIAEEERKAVLKIIWSRDWLKCALIINGYCHAVFDFDRHGGYNRNEFPPPNEVWTVGDRVLTDELVATLFG